MEEMPASVWATGSGKQQAELCSHSLAVRCLQSGNWRARPGEAGELVWIDNTGTTISSRGQQLSCSFTKQVYFWLESQRYIIITYKQTF